jgi:hypothetical protein
MINKDFDENKGVQVDWRVYYLNKVSAFFFYLLSRVGFIWCLRSNVPVGRTFHVHAKATICQENRKNDFETPITGSYFFRFVFGICLLVLSESEISTDFLAHAFYT